MITPDDKHLLVDAGQEDNMYRFLRWKYSKFRNQCRFDAVVISHPDQDHYRGSSQFSESRTSGSERCTTTVLSSEVEMNL